jgi:hypothetical protein
MLTLKDCLNYCGLNEDEIHVTAELEQLLPDIVAAELGHTLLHTTRGMRIIQRYIRDKMNEGESRGEVKKPELLYELLSQFNGRSSTNGRD